MLWKIIAGQIDLHHRKIFVVAISIGIFFIFVSTKYFPWEQIESISIARDFFDKFQFPWRFMCIGTFFISLSVALSLYQFKHRWKFISIVCILISAWSITFGGNLTFGKIWNDRYGWFWSFPVNISDDLKSVVIGKYTLHSSDYLNTWKISPHDPRIQSVKIENGVAKIFFKSDENFTASVPISNRYNKYDVLIGDIELPHRMEDQFELSIDFPAGSGVVTVNIPRIDSIFDDYIYSGIHAEDAKRWKSEIDPRILNIERLDGKIFVEYDLSKSESNSKIELPIFYFPGHAANVPIESSERHLIQIDPSNLESHGTIEIFYEGLPSFKIANIISLATLIFLLVKIRREGF